MDEDAISETALEWAKANRKQFVSGMLGGADEYLLEPPVVVFMAGLPGAGKTELSRNEEK